MHQNDMLKLGKRKNLDLQHGRKWEITPAKNSVYQNLYYD